jgi:hypothetical protein
MKTTISAIIGAIICFFLLKKCEQPQEVKTITKFKNVPTYVQVTKNVNVPVTEFKYKTLHNTERYYVHDTLNKLVEVVTYDTTKSLVIIPYRDSLITISDSITLSGTILDFKRKLIFKERQPDTLIITREAKQMKEFKYYMGLDSDVNNIFQPSFGVSYDTKKFQVSLGYRPVTKIVEAKFFLPFFKF